MYRIRSNRLLDGFTILPLLAFTAFGGSQIARADAVLDWHEIAVNTVSTASPPRPGPVGFLDMAVVQAAVYDAVQAIDGKFKPYHVQIPGAVHQVGVIGVHTRVVAVLVFGAVALVVLVEDVVVIDQRVGRIREELEQQLLPRPCTRAVPSGTPHKRQRDHRGSRRGLIRRSSPP